MSQAVRKIVIPFTDRGQKEVGKIFPLSMLKTLNVVSAINMAKKKRQQESGAISITCDLIASR